jgi:hypothetical protein
MIMMTADSIHVQPPTTNGHGITIPGHFDTALVNKGMRGDSGIKSPPSRHLVPGLYYLQRIDNTHHWHAAGYHIGRIDALQPWQHVGKPGKARIVAAHTTGNPPKATIDRAGDRS